MAVVGLGIDLVELDRIERSLERFGERFLNRVLTPGELDRLPAPGWRRVEFVAARFAAKEAASKALGTGLTQGVTLRSIEVRDLPSGKPELALHAGAAEHAKTLGVRRAQVSLTHSRSTAGAVVILED